MAENAKGLNAKAGNSSGVGNPGPSGGEANQVGRIECACKNTDSGVVFECDSLREADRLFTALKEKPVSIIVSPPVVPSPSVGLRTADIAQNPETQASVPRGEPAAASSAPGAK